MHKNSKTTPKPADSSTPVRTGHMCDYNCTLVADSSTPVRTGHMCDYNCTIVADSSTPVRTGHMCDYNCTIVADSSTPVRTGHMCLNTFFSRDIWGQSRPQQRIIGIVVAGFNRKPIEELSDAPLNNKIISSTWPMLYDNRCISSVTTDTLTEWRELYLSLDKRTLESFQRIITVQYVW